METDWKRTFFLSFFHFTLQLCCRMLHTIIAFAAIAVAVILPELWMFEGGGCTARGLLLLGGMESQHV